MSASDGLLPAKIKWVVSGCFVGLLGIMIAIYLTSPKLIIDEASSVQSIDATDIQSTSSASIKEQTTASSSAEIKSHPDQFHTDSVVDEDSDISADGQAGLTPEEQALNKNPDDEVKDKELNKCDFSLSSEKMIFGVQVTLGRIVATTKAYFTPALVTYKKEKETRKGDKNLTWFCTEREAKEAGYTNMLQLLSL